MFVVFEGIDGSGKTTVSNKVAKKLRKRGIDVEHLREGGEFASPYVRRMREFGKDSRNMGMKPLSELLFYLARDAQLLSENIRPALARGGLVFADRYVYSYEVLSHHGRGLDLSQVRPILDGVAGGVWPDLVVLMDVDPYVARARRKVSKIDRKAKGKLVTGGSRKGLGGIGTQHRLRKGYLSIAERESDRWLVIDNSDVQTGLKAVVRRVTDAIEALVKGMPAPDVIAKHSVPRNPMFAAGEEGSFFEAARAAFYEAIAARAEAEPEVAAYFLSGLEDEQAWEWRDRLADDAPHIIAYGLRGLGGERAWAMRERLAEKTPYWIARSLDGREVEGPRAELMRRRFLASQPKAVLATLDGVDTDAAWALRDGLFAELPRDVLTSTKRIDTERAWALRDRYLSDCGGEPALADPHVATGLADAVRGLDCERAWALRRLCIAEAPAAVLWSLSGLVSDEAWDLRDEYVTQAPKIVLRTFDEVDHPRAWELRRMHAARVKEALDSMVGLAAEAGWEVREACRDIWPSTAVKSLGDLIATARGSDFAERVLRSYPDNISLLKHVSRGADLVRASAAGERAG